MRRITRKSVGRRARRFFARGATKAGFEVVALGRDTLEGWVRRPPTTHAEVATRLEESMTFCPDYVEGFAGRLLMILGQAWQFRFD